MELLALVEILQSSEERNNPTTSEMVLPKVLEILVQLKGEDEIIRKTFSVIRNMSSLVELVIPMLMIYLQKHQYDISKIQIQEICVILQQEGLASESALPLLIDIFENNEDVEIKGAACAAIGAMKFKALPAIPILKRALANCSDNYLQGAIEGSLRRIGVPLEDQRFTSKLRQFFGL